MIETKEYTFETILEEKGFFLYTNVGASMLPLLRERRDIIEIRNIPRRAQKYDVVLYKRGDKYVLHRCLASLADGKYIFAGDHNIVKEYDVTDDMIIGIMTRVIRDGKSIYPNNVFYKIYCHIWVDFFPLKCLILRLKTKARDLRT